MPLLNFPEIVHMLSLPPITCHECGRVTYQNYCRQCDEYYRAGHARDCTMFGDHAGHRIYPTLPTTPFVSTPADWALYLDVIRERHIWIEHDAIKALFGETLGTKEYHDTFMDMGYKALEWATKQKLHDGGIYQMHFDGTTVELRIGVLGGQVMLFTPKREHEANLKVEWRR